jgi:membrane-anchored protein YejM (alkaline phosphatase superfamily)
VDHVALGSDFDPIPYKNRYRTALRYVDTQIERVFEHLEQSQQLNNTIVVITSDHGEEFNETGKNYWGHGSNFTEHQIHVPLLILWPGKAQHTFTHRTTHYDLVPTIMHEGLGIETPISEYSTGRSLFDEVSHQWVLVHSYFNYGVVMQDRIITTYPTGNYEVSDPNLNPTDKTMPAATSLEVLKDITRFYAD